MRAYETNRSWRRSAAIVTLLLPSILVGCGSRRSSAAAAAGDDVCVADAAGRLHLLPTVPNCAADEWACRLKCKAGDGGSCLALGYSASGGDARRLYGQACILGVANGCTNYAASIWADDASDAQLACARRTFEKACAVKEPFACGMIGRFMLESTDPPPYAEGRRYLEKACDQVGGFSCRVLAKHLKSGNLGQYRPETIRVLLTRACATGDPDACGKHATATETFH